MLCILNYFKQGRKFSKDEKYANDSTEDFSSSFLLPNEWIKWVDEEEEEKVNPLFIDD